MTDSCMEGSSHFQVQVQLDPPHSVPSLHTGQMLEISVALVYNRYWIFRQLIQKSPQTIHMVYFWKALGTRTPMAMFRGVKHANTQIQRQIQIEIRKYNYSGNRTIQLQWKMDHTCAIFLESPVYKDLYDNALGYHTCKYTNTINN